ncbi:hypothetical protein PS723_02438 [Pseudomonas fluorescens]|uniref:Uncharacterized protein n=1 Tax=Pseudomonas fluorescens TaxID=294 RepID=A0A5E7C2T5_PSEFL|nr:hypothetical protein PS723_02438 [Pseudomonas fluorescens]
MQPVQVETKVRSIRPHLRARQMKPDQSGYEPKQQRKGQRPRADASHSLRKRVVCQRRFTVRLVSSRRMQIRSDVINVYAPREEFS